MISTIFDATRAIGFVLLVALALSASSAAIAGEYSVQIGAFRDVASGYAERAAEVGELYTERTRDGVTRFQIGRFETQAAAQAARSALIGAGYADAFVVEKRVVEKRVVEKGVARADIGTTRVANEAAPRPSAAPAPARDPLAGVPESLRSRVVLLDGAYHVKEGDRFVPLAEALASEE